MKKRYFIIVFVILFIVSIVAVFRSDKLLDEKATNSDKIKAGTQGLIKGVGKKIEGPLSVATEQIKETANSVYEGIKDKGGELTSAMIIDPATGIAKDLVKKALSAASSSLLTKEDVKEILKDDSCKCQ